MPYKSKIAHFSMDCLVISLYSFSILQSQGISARREAVEDAVNKRKCSISACEKVTDDTREGKDYVLQ